MSTRIYSIQVPANLAPLSNDCRAKMNSQTVGGLPVDESCCCVLCGKYLPNKKPAFVLLSNETKYVTEAELTDHDLGTFPVGSDCAKKLKKAGVSIYQYNSDWKLIPA